MISCEALIRLSCDTWHMLGLEDGPALGKDSCRNGSTDPGTEADENFSGSRWKSSVICIVLAND